MDEEPWLISRRDLLKAALAAPLAGCVTYVPSHPLLHDPALLSSLEQEILSTPPNFKAAFIGDQGLGENSRAVLQLIRDEGTQMVLHSGDFDYDDNPSAWDRQISDILGPEFPYFASVGNHDLCKWPWYQERLYNRISRVRDAHVSGDFGVKSVCLYQGLTFILSGAGLLGDNHDAYIKNQLNFRAKAWKIVSFHMNQRLMQVERKMDDAGWEVYEESRKAGAIVVTGHAHVYSRTHLLSSCERQAIASTSNTLELSKGKTFVVVSGLGGRSVRHCIDELARNNWWASVYTKEQNAQPGALFVEFNIDRMQNKAIAYFKDITGRVPDRFYIVNKEM